MEIDDFVLIFTLFIGYLLLSVLDYSVKDLVERAFSKIFRDGEDDHVSSIHDVQARFDAAAERMEELVRQAEEEVKAPRKRGS